MMQKAKINPHDDVIKWKLFPRYWPFVRGIHRSPVNSPHKGQWRPALMFSVICTRINGWVNNREAGDLRRNLAHHDVTVMEKTRLYLVMKPVSRQWHEGSTCTLFTSSFKVVQIQFNGNVTIWQNFRHFDSIRYSKACPIAYIWWVVKLNIPKTSKTWWCIEQRISEF